MHTHTHASYLMPLSGLPFIPPPNFAPFPHQVILTYSCPWPPNLSCKNGCFGLYGKAVSFGLRKIRLQHPHLHPHFPATSNLFQECTPHILNVFTIGFSTDVLEGKNVLQISVWKKAFGASGVSVCLCFDSLLFPLAGCQGVGVCL